MLSNKYYILFFVFIIACKNKPDTIAVKKMAAILTDIHLTEASAQFYKTNDSIVVSRQDSSKKYMAIVLGKHQITQQQFTDNIAWYKNNPELLDSVYGLVITNLSIMDTIQSRK